MIGIARKSLTSVLYPNETPRSVIVTLSLPASPDLLDERLDVPGREELALLHVDDPAVLRRGLEEVRLPAQERRDLEDVGDFGGGAALRRARGRR